MPKIISGSIISSSDNRDDGQQGLHLYYCLCSEFILVVDVELDQLPKRQTDNATILANATRMYKLNAIQGNTKMVQRSEDEFEKQHRLHCQRCNLWIAYETTPHLKGGPFTYIVQGALTETQGKPQEDWELDLPSKPHDDSAAEMEGIASS